MTLVKIVPMPGSQGVTGPQGPAGTNGGAYAPQTWTAPNDAAYSIHQAHGGVEVSTTGSETYVYSNAFCIGTIGGGVGYFYIEDGQPLDAMIAATDGSHWNRKFYIEDSNGVQANIVNANRNGANEFAFYFDYPIALQQESTYTIVWEYGGQPAVWWTADSLGIIPEGEEWKFRGAKIDYHAYSTDSGTMIGTIYIAHDSGDHGTSHIEVTSGGTDISTIILWKRDSSNYHNERNLYAYRLDGEASTTKIHWTAQVYYGTEYYD